MTTWDNPLAASAAASASASTPTQPHPPSNPHPTPSTSTPAPTLNYGGIDPDLAYLDPNLSRFASAGSSAPSFAAAFNAKTGRFQAGGPREGGVASRQEEHYYDAKGWRESLEGKGLAAVGRGSGDEEAGGGRKRPSAKEVVSAGRSLSMLERGDGSLTRRAMNCPGSPCRSGSRLTR